MKTRLLLVALSAFCLLALVPGAASAYRYSVNVDEEHFVVYDLDPALSSTVRVTRGGVDVNWGRADQGAGNPQAHIDPETFLPGDVIEVYQPQTADPTPDSVPVATFTVPNFTVSGSATGATGAAPDGWTVYVTYDPGCAAPPSTGIAVAAGGAYNIAFPMSGRPGGQFRSIAVSANGDLLGSIEDFRYSNLSWEGINYRTPGDGQCMSVINHMGKKPVPDNAEIWLNDLDNSIPSTRIVLSRGGAVLADENTDDLYLPDGVRVLPGDTINVYRPQDAGTPAYGWTIPAISGIYDPGNDLAAVDAPAASYLDVWACRPVVCRGQDGGRSTIDTPAGRTIFSFAQPESYQRPFDVQPGDDVSASWTSTDYRFHYGFDLAQGDLTAPIGKITLARTLKAKKLGKKKLKFTFVSNEAGSVVSALTMSGKTKKSKPVTLAKAKRTNVIAGRNKLALSFTKTGKKALKALTRKSKKGKKAKKRKATLTVTLTDTAGNVTTVVRSTTIKG